MHTQDALTSHTSSSNFKAKPSSVVSVSRHNQQVMMMTFDKNYLMNQTTYTASEAMHVFFTNSEFKGAKCTPTNKMQT